MATITASGYNQQIISEIKPQQITLAQYQAQQQQQQQMAAVAVQQHQQQQQQLAAAQQLVVQQQQQQHQQQQQQQQQHQVKMQLQSPVTQQFATGTPTFTCTTFNAVPATVTPVTLAAAAPPPQTVNVHQTATALPIANAVQDSFEEKVNYFKLKEAELRYKEQQVALEKKKIELSHAQESLKNLRDMHRLQVEEMKLKISILQEEEKILQRQQQG